jgi:hypothetical protein
MSRGVCTHKDHMTVEQHSLTMSKVVRRERERTASLEAGSPSAHPLLVELAMAIRTATEDALPAAPAVNLEPSVTRSQALSGRPAASGNRNAQGALRRLLRDVRRSLDVFDARRQNDWQRPPSIIEPDPAPPVRCRHRDCPIGESKSFAAWTVENGVRFVKTHCPGCGSPYPNINMEGGTA